MDKYAIHIALTIFLGFLVLFCVNGGKPAKRLAVNDSERVVSAGFVRQ